MDKETTERVTVTVENKRLESLRVEGKRRGLKLPLFCRILLTEMADEFEKKAKAA
jgi:hypothetical protein